MKIEIKSWYTGGVIFSIETDSWKLAVEAAVKAKADLRYANLRSANLRSADLSSADLSYADLRYANLRSANLRSADLSSADLSSANLRYADLRSADLRSADLRSADLSYADLSSANLSSANLRYADLRSADLSSADLRYANLSSANGIKDVLQIGPIGSRRDCLTAILDDKDKLKIIAGCFVGSLKEFEEKVEETHGSNEFGQQYRAAIKLIKVKLMNSREAK